jgi:hypothetical protein
MSNLLRPLHWTELVMIVTLIALHVAGIIKL